MTIDAILSALQNTSVAQAIATGSWQFPTVETMHVMAFSITVGSILMVDLRLLGFNGGRRVTAVTQEYLPYTWIAFVLAAITGSLMFISKPQDYLNILPFKLKFLGMALAGVNMLVFHSSVYRRVMEWNQRLPPPRSARVAGGLSILFWCAVIVMGRVTGWVA